MGVQDQLVLQMLHLMDLVWQDKTDASSCVLALPKSIASALLHVRSCLLVEEFRP